MRFDLPRDLILPKKGPRAWLRRLLCRWRGEHTWDKKDLQRPYPLRPLTCTHCGDVWKYFTAAIPPPRIGCVHKECPNCLMLVEHEHGQDWCTCRKCGWEFKVDRRAKHTCQHCGRKGYLDEECPGCGAQI
jgi:hypothetical protein